MIHQLNINKLELIRPLVEERVREAGLIERMPPDLLIATIESQAQSGHFNIFVDNVENPTALVILVVGTAPMLAEITCSIIILHVAQSVKDESPKTAARLASEMMQHSEAFARQRGCDCVRANSWEWRGHGDDSALCEQSGMEKQSVAYVKMLREGAG
tara:strand:+ start:394 stop:867 length:474 start_codon:yes stop_codon:yes gene_type:complete